MPRQEYNYRNISLPKGLIRQVKMLMDELQKEGFDMSYTSVAEFVKEAIRQRIAELRKIYLLGENEEPQ